MSFAQPPAGPQDAGTVPVRVQVIDMEPFALDLVVPTYLSAGDLTQRVARDAGLGAYWEDGTRRMFWLRARGRVLQDNERLDDLGIVPYELLHLLPQPPQGTGVEERPPEYPQTKGYGVAGNLIVVGSLVMMGIWTTGWALALTVSQEVWVGMLPALGLALLCTSFARHLLGGQGSNWKIPVLALFVFFPQLGLAGIPAVVFSGVAIQALLLALVTGLVIGLFGVLLGWLAWYGAVEKLPERVAAQVKADEAAAVYNCGICGLEVTPDVRMDCKFGCGQVFHSGCFMARQSVYQGTGCAVCGYQPPAA
ncbi:MAG: hypothetical protein JRJ84_12705 [Deltaproteobacteria bacterium]|nr:hypothetical protein [Deltaproteobacteria bacterium]